MKSFVFGDPTSRKSDLEIKYLAPREFPEFRKVLSGAESFQPPTLVLARENDGVGGWRGTSTARRADASVNENRGPR